MTSQGNRDRQLERLWNHIPTYWRLNILRILRLLYVASASAPCPSPYHQQEVSNAPHIQPADRGP